MVSRRLFSLTFSRRACLFTSALFAIECIIATYFHDPLLRSFGGDVLVMPLMYSFLRMFVSFSGTGLVWALFAFACLIEIGQYFHLASWLGLAPHSWGEIILGATFDPKDLLAYALGTGLNLWLSSFLPQSDGA